MSDDNGPRTDHVRCCVCDNKFRHGWPVISERVVLDRAEYRYYHIACALLSENASVNTRACARTAEQVFPDEEPR